MSHDPSEDHSNMFIWSSRNISYYYQSWCKLCFFKFWGKLSYCNNASLYIIYWYLIGNRLNITLFLTSYVTFNYWID